MTTEPENCVHGMTPTWCATCTAQRPHRDLTVFITPQHLGHLGDCALIADEDTSTWGEARVAGAWRNLCAGREIVADEGAVVGLTAATACEACVASEELG